MRTLERHCGEVQMEGNKTPIGTYRRYQLVSYVRIPLKSITQSLQQMVLARLDNHMQKNEIRPLSYTTHKNFLKI